MKKILYYTLIFISMALIPACGHKHSDDHDHDHEGEEQKDDHDSHETIGAISFSEEQAQNILEFQVDTIQRQTFYQILKTNGQILSAPGDEVLISATMSGIVNISIPYLVEGYTVSSGQKLFSISSRNLSENNASTKLNEAKVILATAEADFDRAQKLIADKIISQKDFEQVKLSYEQAKLNYQTYAAGMSPNGKIITTPMSGFVKNLLVQSGQYVEMGQALATVSQNKRLVLRADVSQRYLHLIKNAGTATFTTPYDNKTYKLSDLNGTLISTGRSSGNNSYYTPINFEFDNKGNFIEGSFVEVYLKSYPIEGALVLPVSALIEEQGRFFVFVALEHEHEYLKKEVKIGASDGINRQILSGIEAGERVVTKGAYALKLASMTNAVPTHSH